MGDDVPQVVGGLAGLDFWSRWLLCTPAGGIQPAGAQHRALWGPLLYSVSKCEGQNSPACMIQDRALLLTELPQLLPKLCWSGFLSAGTNWKCSFSETNTDKNEKIQEPPQSARYVHSAGNVPLRSIV